MYSGHEWVDLPTTKDVKVAKVIKILATKILPENRKSKQIIINLNEQLKSIYQLLILTIIFSLSSACTEENTDIRATELLTMTEIQALGIQHNEALAQTFEGLKNVQMSEIKNSAGMELVLNQELDKYYRSNFKNESSVEIANDYSSKEVSKFFGRANNTNSRLSGMSPIEITISEHSEFLSSGQVEFLNEIDFVLSLGSSLEETVEALNELQQKASNELSDEQAQVILIGAEIGKASMTYWSENLDNWEDVINQNEGGRSARVQWFDWSEVAGADVGGAVGGAVGAAAVNLLPGAGQIAYGSAIVGGAAGGSATDAVIQVWNHYF